MLAPKRGFSGQTRGDTRSRNLYNVQETRTEYQCCSVVVKDLRLKDEDRNKESSFKDKDKDDDLKIGPRADPRGQGLSSRTTTL